MSRASVSCRGSSFRTCGSAAAVSAEEYHPKLRAGRCLSRNGCKVKTEQLKMKFIGNFSALVPWLGGEGESGSSDPLVAAFPRSHVRGSNSLLQLTVISVGDNGDIFLPLASS